MKHGQPRWRLGRRPGPRSQPAVDFRVEVPVEPELASRSQQAENSEAFPLSKNQATAARRLGTSASRRASHRDWFSPQISSPAASASARYQAACRSPDRPLPRRLPPAAPARTRAPSPASGTVARPRYRLLGAASCCRPERRRRSTREPAPLQSGYRLGRLQREATGEDGQAARDAPAPRASSRSWLQAMASRIVCCRCGRSRPPPVSSGSRWSSRASSADGERTLTRAAASSMASGRPSRRRQIAATAWAFCSVTAKSGLTACARADEEAHRGRCVDGSRGCRVVALRQRQGQDRDTRAHRRDGAAPGS